MKRFGKKIKQHSRPLPVETTLPVSISKVMNAAGLFCEKILLFQSWRIQCWNLANLQFISKVSKYLNLFSLIVHLMEILPWPNSAGHENKNRISWSNLLKASDKIIETRSMSSLRLLSLSLWIENTLVLCFYGCSAAISYFIFPTLFFFGITNRQKSMESLDLTRL